MAIINSLAIGKSVKSAGNLTYKTVRGRTIASQRITQNKSNTLPQQIQREKFKMVSQSMLLFRSYIEKCYEKSKYGSIRNSFFKQNPNFTLGGQVGEILEGLVTLTDGFFQAIERPEGAQRQLHFLSSGSLPCLVSMDIEELPTVSVLSKSYTNVNSITGDTVFNFPSPYKISEVSMVGVALLSDTLFVNVSKADESGEFSFGTNINAAKGGYTVKATLDGEMVTSITVTNESPEISPTGNLFFFIPSVNGKVPNTTAAYVPHE